MFRCPLDLGKGTALQFGRCILRFPDGTAEYHAILGVTDLEGIGIDECDKGSVREQDIGLMDIANDVITSMESVHSRRKAIGRAVQIAIVEERTALATRQGIVVFDERTPPGDMRHKKADNTPLAVRSTEQVNGPGNGDMPLVGHRI